LLSELAGNGSILWVTGVPASSERVSGPFVNPNHFAAWLEMVIPATVAYVLVVMDRVRRRLGRAAHAARGRGMHPRQAWVSALIVHQRRLWAPLAACAGLLLMALAHVASGSRGGRAALLAGLAVAGAGMASSAGRSPRRRWAAAAVALALVLAAGLSVALWRAADEVRAAEAVDVSLASRLAVSAAGSAIVRDHPLFGTGLGSWLHAFRPYQAPPVEGGIWDHAHNDYLELAAEGGLAGVALVLLFALALVRAAARRPAPAAPVAAPSPDRERSAAHSREFELPDWRAALGQPSCWRSRATARSPAPWRSFAGPSIAPRRTSRLTKRSPPPSGPGRKRRRSCGAHSRSAPGPARSATASGFSSGRAAHGRRAPPSSRSRCSASPRWRRTPIWARPASSNRTMRDSSSRRWTRGTSSACAWRPSRTRWPRRCA